METEDKNKEFKREMVKGKELHKELSAFANTDGGILYIGVDDKGEFYKTPIESIEQVHNTIKGFCDETTLIYINDIWNLKYVFYKENNEHKVIMIEIKVSSFAIPTIIKKKNIYYVRTFDSKQKIKEVNFEEVIFRKKELAPTNEKFNIINFKNLHLMKRDIENLSYRKSYNLVDKDDNLTVLGKIFEDKNNTIIQYKEKRYFISEINSLFENLTLDLNETRDLTPFRISYIELIEKITFISRELILNSICHGNLFKEIVVELNNNGVFSVKNNWPTRDLAIDFINLIVKKEIYHHSLYRGRTRVLKELKLVETKSRGYNEIIKPNDLDYNVVFIRNDSNIKIDIVSSKIHKDINKYANNYSDKNEEVIIWK